jgi:lysozyme family protein
MLPSRHTDDVFDLAVCDVLRREGGYVNDPRDPGGETNFGISKRSYPSVDIKALTREQAIEIYRRDYWRGPNIAAIPHGLLAVKVFDLAVNCGVRTAIRFVQYATNKLTRPCSVGSIEVDGMIGATTLDAIARVNEAALFGGVLREAYYHYIRLSKSYPQYRVGWLNRLWDF